MTNITKQLNELNELLSDIHGDCTDCPSYFVDEETQSELTATQSLHLRLEWLKDNITDGNDGKEFALNTIQMLQKLVDKVGELDLSLNVNTEVCYAGEYLEQITCGLDDTELEASEVLAYMLEYDKMPANVYLCENLELVSPKELAKGVRGVSNV